MKKPNCHAIHPIRTDADYRAALALDDDAGAHFEAMLALIEAYEAEHYSMISPNPMGAIFLHAS